MTEITSKKIRSMTEKSPKKKQFITLHPWRVVSSMQVRVVKIVSSGLGWSY